MNPQTFCLLALAACAGPGSLPVTAPDLDAAAPARESMTLRAFADHFADASKMVATASVEAFLPPMERPPGYATWRRDWSVKRIVGTYRYVMHKSVCDSWIPLPMLHHGKSEPMVGRPIDVEGITAALAAPVEWPAVMLVGLDSPPLDIDLGAIGMTGCRLAMSLTDALGSIDQPWLTTSRRLGTGRIRVEWTPTDAFAGRTVTLQLLVFVPRNVAPSGMLTSSALAIHIGRP